MGGRRRVRCAGRSSSSWARSPRSRRISVKLDESNAHALSIDGAEQTGYGLGKAGWVTVPLRAKGVNVALLREWVEESYRIVAPKRLVAELDGAAAQTT